MWSWLFWRAALERIVASFAGAILAVIGADFFDVIQADWVALLSVGAGAAVVSLLKALVAGSTGNGSPSLTSAESLAVKPGDRVPGPDHAA